MTLPLDSCPLWPIMPEVFLVKGVQRTAAAPATRSPLLPQPGRPVRAREAEAPSPLTCWACRSTPGLAFSGSGSRSRCSSPFLGCICRHRQVTPHSARMLVAVPRVAPSAITGTESTMAPAPVAGLGPPRSYPARARRRRRRHRRAAAGIRTRQQLSRCRRGGEGGRLQRRQRRRPGRGRLCARTQHHINGRPLSANT